MKLTKEQRQNYKNFILASIIDDPAEIGYDVKPFNSGQEINEQKIRFFFETFQSEFSWSIERYGEYKSLIDYLQGLPSTIDIPFENYRILELAKNFGSLPVDYTEKQADKILANYWHFMATQLLQLKRKYIKE